MVRKAVCLPQHALNRQAPQAAPRAGQGLGEDAGEGRMSQNGAAGLGQQHLRLRPLKRGGEQSLYEPP